MPTDAELAKGKARTCETAEKFLRIGTVRCVPSVKKSKRLERSDKGPAIHSPRNIAET